ncbi:MAG: DinB family protein [Saprospiraceae bacterium]|nr:DinB family protein [Saprospiraceae bacterium]
MIVFKPLALGLNYFCKSAALNLLHLLRLEVLIYVCGLKSRILSTSDFFSGPYLLQSRQKCRNFIESLTDEKLKDRFTEGSEQGDMDYPILEILLYNMRHTQHHAAQLNMMIRQDLNEHMEWSFREGDIKLDDKI